MPHNTSSANFFRRHFMGINPPRAKRFASPGLFNAWDGKRASRLLRTLSTWATLIKPPVYSA